MLTSLSWRDMQPISLWRKTVRFQAGIYAQKLSVEIFSASVAFDTLRVQQCESSYFFFIFIGNGCKLLIKIWRKLAEILFILAWKKYPLIPIATNVCDDNEMSHVFSRRKRCCWHCNIWPDWFTSHQSHIIVYITMVYRSLWENVRY